MELLEHFDFDIHPFADTVNPAFFFQTHKHERALVRTMYAVTDRRGLGLIWGVSGSGKTFVSQMLLRKLDREKFEPVLLLCAPGMTKTPMLREIMFELGEEEPPYRAQNLLDMIQQRVMEEHAKGRRIVLLVDEAHFLASNSLHTVRTLTNLETTTEKLLTIILFAEDRFLRRLKHPSYASLRSRISIETELSPLDEEETEQYIKFRLMVAGGQVDLFSPDCFPLIYRKSGGIPREISKVADNALLEAFSQGRRVIEPEILEASWSSAGTPTRLEI
jgi:general secretion pathway protein A